MSKCPFSKVGGQGQYEVPPLATALRDSTAEAHKRAEHHPLQQAMVRGEIDRPTFIRIVQEMRRVHLALDVGLEALRVDPKFAAWGNHILDREPVFEADLTALGSDLADFPRVAPTRATVALAARIKAYVAAGFLPAVVGAIYVVEGSTNGGMFISKAVERALSLGKGEGTAWLNPYGDGVRVRWATARTILDGLNLTAQQAHQAIEGADAMFLTIEAVMQDLQQELGSPTSLDPALR